MNGQPTKLVRRYLRLDFTDNTWLQRLWFFIRFIMTGRASLPIGWSIEQPEGKPEEVKQWPALEAK